MTVSTNRLPKIVLTIVLLVITKWMAYPQFKQNYASMENQAKIYFEKQQFYKALRLYLKLDSLKPDNQKFNYQIGVCYINQYNNIKALPYFEKCLQQAEKYPLNLHYYSAKALQLSHRFDEAITRYNFYKEKIQKKKKNQKLVEEIDREIASCSYGKEMVSKPTNIKVINLGDTINSEFADYGPVLTADQQTLIFTSARPNTTGGEIDESDGRYYEDIYISYRLNSGWTAPLGIGPGINTNGHDASISLSPDGQKLLIYRYDQDLLSSGIPGDLYVSKLKGTTWTNATKLPQSINTRAWEPSACYSADERSLFFSSNREGGKGGTDLYMVRQLPNGEWALPMNLGDKLNTPFDEDSPFIHPDGKTLYFSSNGHKTMGGYDIFVSRYDEEKKEWSTPENLGYPINTAHDDIHFTLTADGRRVYFSSIRPEGKGDNDIYYADMNTESADVVVIKGIVSDSVTKQPKEALITVYDTNTNELIGKYNSNSSTGKYIIILTEGKKYNITVEAEKYILHFENFDASKLKGFEEKEKNISLSPKK